ncbi:MAG: endonuclease, partial [Bacteroidales bacterium]|nr:endonuclease [Bacteroidales bacterium]
MKRKFTIIMKLLLANLFFISLSHTLIGQVPANYYDSATPYTDGADLKQKLHDIITSGHTPITYTDLWTAFQTTDRDDNASYENDGSVFDKYSENPTGTDPYNFSYTADQCGTYSGEGGCYNREHSFPKSWWGGSTTDPQYTDLNHLIPSDGYVNSKRSSYPYGETTSPSWTSLNGSKLGPSSYSGISGTVFEPLDDFKGDFARMLFYMATRYKDEIPTWYSTGTDIQKVFQSTGEFQPAYYQMLYAWHIADPVSQKELARNDDVYDIQGNANPYINHPEWVCVVFGGCSVKPEPTNYPANFLASAVSSSQIDLSW